MNPRLLPRWARILPLVFLLVLVGGSARYASSPVQQAIAESGTPTALVPDDERHVLPVKPDPVAAPAELPGGAIGRLSIPRIAVNAVAREVGVLPSGAMDTTPGIWDVGVFNRTVRPGEPGNALIEGHLDWFTGPAVFYHLHTLTTGDAIDFAYTDGTVHHFAVSGSRTVSYTAPIPDDLYAREGTPTITLITCSGTYIRSAHSYSTRLLLTASLVQ
jgi:sortase (surface protein transpeptidase)